ncbi:hypothetical protein ACHHV8_15945 [Paenibacillus sp. TAB 01]|uniref:hypothetical protein n=1 Tax=Paenibacillus sp. TAB 01 TaxID=3368988 RepID=UPI0037520CA5
MAKGRGEGERQKAVSLLRRCCNRLEFSIVVKKGIGCSSLFQAVEKATLSEPCEPTQVGYLLEEFTSAFEIRENAFKSNQIHGFQQRLEEDTPPEYHPNSGCPDKLEEAIPASSDLLNNR